MPYQESLASLAIRRPVLMVVINLLVMVAGAAALMNVEIRELPDVDRPQITVRASYDGASPETLDTEVTSVLESAIARVQGIKTMRSGSEENSCRVRVELQPGVNINDAANDIREAVSRNQRQLPENVENIFVIKANDDAEAIIQLAAISDSLTKEELAKRVEKDVIPALMAVPDIAEVRLSGNQQRVLRVLLNPARMSSLKVSVAEVAQTLRNARLDVPAGSFESIEQDFLVRANATVVDPDLLLKLYIRENVRLGDIATAFFGPEDTESYARLNGHLVIGLDIVRQAGGNTIAISDGVKVVLRDLNERLNELEIFTTADDAEFILGAIEEVISSLLISVLVVVLIIALFIGQFFATLVPAVTIPIALIGTFAAIWLMGLSINLLTLLAMVLATGLIVDDAIVVLENIQRHRRHGAGPLAAAVAGTNQVFFAVIATTVTLASVFLPIAFLPSETGQLFREFGLVLAIAVSISSFVALTLCPMLASRLPNARENHPLFKPVRRLLEDSGDEFSSLYSRSLKFCLKFRYPVLFVCILLSLFSLDLLKHLPQELLPEEDRGVLRVMATGPDGSSLLFSDGMSEQVEAILKPYQDAGIIDTMYTTIGQWDKNRAYTVATLKPWKERTVSQMELSQAIQNETDKLAGIQVMIRNANSLGIRGAGGGGLELAITGDNFPNILTAAEKLAETVEKEIPSITRTRVMFDTSQPELSFSIDRDKATDLKVSVEAISQTLRAMVDGYEVTDFNIDDEGVPVILGSMEGSIKDPQDLLSLYIPNQDGELISLLAFVSIEESGVAAELNRHEQRRAIEIRIDLKADAVLSETMQQVQQIGNRILPSGTAILFLGDAADLEQASHDVAITFGLALLIVFLVLAAQFESIGSALIVIFTVPFGLAAAVYALALTGQSINLYSQIGLIMLVGLITKNAILLVEFMDQLREKGLSVEDSIIRGVKVRFRPVMMTVLSTVIGSLPLILSTGPGSEARSAIGWVVFGGLGMATFFTLYLTPVGYALIAPLFKPRSYAEDDLNQQMQNLVLVDETDEA